MWERSQKELVGLSYFTLLSELSYAHWSSHFGPAMFQPEHDEISKVFSYSLRRVFECAAISGRLSSRPKVLSSQFTRVVLSVTSTQPIPLAIHIKTRLSSPATFHRFLDLHTAFEALSNSPPLPNPIP